MDLFKITWRPRIILFLIILLSTRIISHGQTKARITDVDFKLDDRYITISYNLTGTLPKEELNIQVKFVSDKDEVVVPKSIVNDVGIKVYGDGQKAIIWDVVSDQVSLAGNWKAEVSIVSSRVLYSGPGNAILSLIIPGLGGYYVDTKKGRAVLTTLSVIGLGAFGAFEKIQADKSYDDYKSATKSSEIETLYSKANDLNHKYYIATRAAAGIMAIDFIYVLIKGAHNKKVAKNAYNAYSGDGFKLQYVNNSIGIGYSRRF